MKKKFLTKTKTKNYCFYIVIKLRMCASFFIIQLIKIMYEKKTKLNFLRMAGIASI